MERICENCQLFQKQRQICGVSIIHEGKYINLPVSPKDPCFFEQDYFNPITKEKENFNEIKQIRMFEDGGSVKFEYPK